MPVTYRGFTVAIYFVCAFTATVASSSAQAQTTSRPKAGTNVPANPSRGLAEEDDMFSDSAWTKPTLEENSGASQLDKQNENPSSKQNKLTSEDESLNDLLGGPRRTDTEVDKSIQERLRLEDEKKLNGLENTNPQAVTDPTAKKPPQKPKEKKNKPLLRGIKC